MEMENIDKAIAKVSGLQVGTYHFRLAVKDQQGLSSTTTLSVTVRKGELRQRAGGSAGGGGWAPSSQSHRPWLSGNISVCLLAIADTELCLAKQRSLFFRPRPQHFLSFVECVS